MCLSTFVYQKTCGLPYLLTYLLHGAESFLRSLSTWVILNLRFLRKGIVSTSPNPQVGEPPLVGCPRLLIQFIHSYCPCRRPFLHPQPEDAPCRGDRDPHSWCGLPYVLQRILIKFLKERLSHAAFAPFNCR
jgi:hypothetical protein